MLSIILTSLYFFLPAYFANMAPILFRKIPFLSFPIHEKLFGAHKTWRGLMIAPIIGTLIFFLQKLAYTYGFTSLALIDYSDFPLYFGTLLGAGAILGDLIKSYYKRKAGIAPGVSWMPLDQLDFVIGAIIAGFFVYVPPAEVVLILFLISPLLHIGANLIGYYLGINKNKF